MTSPKTGPKTSPKTSPAPAPLIRCPWSGLSDPLYERYHDEEWGVPHANDRAMLEKLTLEGFQSGLSWITILRKREAFRRAFDGFDPEKVARYGTRDVERLMADAGIVRHSLKIQAAIDNARVYLKLAERMPLSQFLWGFLPDGPIINKHSKVGEVPPQTALSLSISKALKVEGFRFVGPTTVYAFMQSVGMVNDHLTTCYRHAACAELQRKFRPPRGPAR